MDLVIAGLRFIAENQNLSADELADGLKTLGCDWTWDDWHARFDGTPKIELYDGVRIGAISCGASIILNMSSRSDFDCVYGKDRLLSVDDGASIYHFIRIVTGDDSYTKKLVDERIVYHALCEECGSFCGGEESMP